MNFFFLLFCFMMILLPIDRAEARYATAEVVKDETEDEETG